MASSGWLRFGRVGLAEAGDELQRHPAEDVVGDGGRIADVGVLGEAGRLEAHVGEFSDQGLQGHAVLQRQAGQGADAVHQPADGGAFLGHGDEQLARLVVLEQADGEVTLVARDVELVSDGGAGVGEAAAQGLAGLGGEPGDFGFEFLDAGFQRGGVRAAALSPPSLVRFVLSGWERLEPSR